MPVVALPTVNLYYQLQGRPDRPSLLLLHGALATFETSWRQLIGEWTKQYHLIGVDLRGHGRSNNPLDRLDLRQMADDIANLLDDLGLSAVHLCGFSGGAATALFFAQRHPQRLKSLILISTNYQKDQARAAQDFWNIERIKREQPRRWQRLTEMHDVDVARLFRWWVEEDSRRPNFAAHELNKIQIPTLVIGGDRDRIIPLDQTLGLYHHLPQAQLAVLPNVGHDILDQQPTLLDGLVSRFLAETAG